MVMDRMGFNPISPSNGLFNGQQINSLLNGAKDGLKYVTCEQTLTKIFHITIKQLLALPCDTPNFLRSFLL